jgi:hypothetical protein
MGNAIVGFARWYWRRVKEIPLVVCVFAIGAIYGSVAVEAAHRSPQAISFLHSVAKAKL